MGCAEAAALVEGSGAREVTIGFGSCLMQSKLPPHEKQGYRPYRVLSRLAQHALDSFVFMGDAVYADFPHFYTSGCCSRPPSPKCDEKCFQRGLIGSPAQLEAQYRLLVEDSHFANFVRTVPTVFTWDDHELFDNYREGTSHTYYPTAREAFERHLARFNPPSYREGELYFVHQVPSPPAVPLAELFVLDGRSHRSRQGLLGETQLEDLREWLLAPTSAYWRFIVSSTMFADVASGIGSDNWSQHIEEKRRVLGLIFDANLPGLVLLSGDAHFVAVVEHHAVRHGAACSLVEVASSPLASVPLRPRSPPASYTGKQQGFDEVVRFLEAGANMYATMNLNRTTAVFRLYRYEERPHSTELGTERLLREAVVQRRSVCATSRRAQEL